MYHQHPFFSNEAAKEILRTYHQAAETHRHLAKKHAHRITRHLAIEKLGLLSFAAAFLFINL